MFKYKGGYIENIQNKKVISVKDRKDVEAQPIWASNRLGGRNVSQLWKIVYPHKGMGSEEIRKKGQMSKDGTGFQVNEPFYLRSRLPMQRVAECVGASNVALKKWYNNRKAQQWRFDPITKTIRNMNWTSYAFSMEGNNLRCRSQTSRWF
jgi:hypothetical protein